MEIIIKGQPKEIADLVLEVQSRRNVSENIGKAVSGFMFREFDEMQKLLRKCQFV